MHTRDFDTPSASAADPAATTGGDPGPTVVNPPTAGNRYRLGEEIARGGMGAVFQATDTHLGREVAVKVLLDRFAPDSGTARRFWDEARITGQLQHPGIPPVYDVGVLSDGRPFLAMKLIKGETLDELLKRRPDPSADRGRWLGVFEKICEAMAYAHAHDVLHRDLKPQNVMVGAFGEVQVMDWGLAKVLTPFSRPTESGADDPDATAAGTAIVSQRDSDDLLTQAGSVLGTPAYMPPEQAIGAIDQIDRRSDVFGLGGILAAVLTGRPPFVGPTPESTRQMAATRKLGDCFERLDGCGAEPDLVALCKQCLAGERDDRPANAKQVADEVAALRAAADERARQAELDRLRVDIRSTEERRRRRMWVTTSSIVVAMILLGGGFAGTQWWRAEQALGQVIIEKGNTESALDRVTSQESKARESLLQLTAAEARKTAALAKADINLCYAYAYLEIFARQHRKNRMPRPPASGDDRVDDFRAKIEKLKQNLADVQERMFSAVPATDELVAMVDSEHTKALSAYRVLSESYPDNHVYRTSLAECYCLTAALMHERGRDTEAEIAYRNALAIFRRSSEERPDDTEIRSGLAGTLDALVLLLLNTQRPSDTQRLESLRDMVAEAALHHETAMAVVKEYTPYKARYCHNRALFVEVLLACREHQRVQPVIMQMLDSATPTMRLLSLYRAARYFSVCSKLVFLDRSIPALQRSIMSSIHCDKSVEYLKLAIVNGWDDIFFICQDPDFAPLHDRTDFQRLLYDLGAAREPAPPPRRPTK